MKDFKKSSEKEKMPHLLSLSIWHKGAWHELLLTRDFENNSEEDQNPNAEESSSLRKAFN